MYNVVQLYVGLQELRDMLHTHPYGADLMRAMQCLFAQLAIRALICNVVLEEAVPYASFSLNRHLFSRTDGWAGDFVLDG